MGDQFQPGPGRAKGPPDPEDVPKLHSESPLRSSRIVVGGRLGSFTHKLASGNAEHVHIGHSGKGIKGALRYHS